MTFRNKEPSSGLREAVARVIDEELVYDTTVNRSWLVQRICELFDEADARKQGEKEGEKRARKEMLDLLKLHQSGRPATLGETGECIQIIKDRGAAKPITATVTQPKIQFCSECGTALGVKEETEPRCTCTIQPFPHHHLCPCYKRPVCTCSEDTLYSGHAPYCPCYNPPAPLKKLPQLSINIKQAHDACVVDKINALVDAVNRHEAELIRHAL